VWHMCL